MKNYKQLVAEMLPVVICAFLPLATELSYQINLYLTWEGAYRLYEGQIPYKDFGMPMGYCYWIIPALFFKLFGPYLFTLAKAQTFLHLISGMSFRWILTCLGVSFRVRFLSMVVFSITFILALVWPQYNHSVIVFQFLGLALLLCYFNSETPWKKWGSIFLSCFFLMFSFLTKQDAGALGIVVASVLVGYYCFSEKSYQPAIWYAFGMVICAAITIGPFLKYGFGYWFNYGQAPHYSRISAGDIVRVIFTQSRWEKFYFILIAGLWLFRRHRKERIDKNENLFTLLVLGLLAEALIFQVTSYVPRDNNFFFHAFCCAYLFYQLDKTTILQHRYAFPVLFIFVCVWWSEKYWKYADRVIGKLLPKKEVPKNVVSINTYIIENEACRYSSDPSSWVSLALPSFQHVKMPAPTAAGIQWTVDTLTQFDHDLKILNMSELTPLAHEVPFQLERGVPLWYHLGVGMFESELAAYRAKITSSYYDVVIYEHLPNLNNFYPFVIRQDLQEHYQQVRAFEAPRSLYLGTIEIYFRKPAGRL